MVNTTLYSVVSIRRARLPPTERVLLPIVASLFLRKTCLVSACFRLISESELNKIRSKMDASGLPQYPEVYPKIDRKDNAAQGSHTQGPSHTSMLLGPENTVAVCQFCHASIKTAVKYTTTSRTHIAAALWGMLCCLCCVPYGSDSAKNSDHYCPNCQRYLGTYVK